MARSNGRINPLQIRPTPVDDNDEIYKYDHIRNRMTHTLEVAQIFN